MHAPYLSMHHIYQCTIFINAPYLSMHHIHACTIFINAPYLSMQGGRVRGGGGVGLNATDGGRGVYKLFTYIFQVKN